MYSKISYFFKRSYTYTFLVVTSASRTFFRIIIAILGTYTFIYKRGLLRHQKMHCVVLKAFTWVAQSAPPVTTEEHPTGVETITCVDSGKNYNTMAKLKQHRQYYCHPDADLNCKWCECSFITKAETGYEVQKAAEVFGHGNSSHYLGRVRTPSCCLRNNIFRENSRIAKGHY